MPSLSEAALWRLEREDDEHDHALPQSLPSDGSGVECDPQGLAGALACLTAFVLALHTTRDAACAIKGRRDDLGEDACVGDEPGRAAVQQCSGGARRMPDSGRARICCGLVPRCLQRRRGPGPSLAEALRGPDAAAWRAVVQKEFDSHDKNQTFEFAQMPPGAIAGAAGQGGAGD